MWEACEDPPLKKWFLTPPSWTTKSVMLMPSWEPQVISVKVHSLDLTGAQQGRVGDAGSIGEFSVL